MKRTIDLIIVFFLLAILCIPMAVISIMVFLTSRGPIFYWSDRVGQNNIIFKMPKFRTMVKGAPNVATHLLGNPDSFVTPIGSFLRQTSLDELPQLFSVLQGEMSMIGPRPALFNQYDLIALRSKKGVDKLIPGITGWAQVNGRDELSISNKVIYDEEYLNNQSFFLDLKILWMTLLKVLNRDSVSH